MSPEAKLYWESSLGSKSRLNIPTRILLSPYLVVFGLVFMFLIFAFDTADEYLP